MKILKFNESKKISGPPMKAYLVTFEPMTRVLAPEYMSEEEVIKLAIPKVIKNLRDDGIYDHFSEIKDDTVMPFDPTTPDDLAEQEYYEQEFKKKVNKRFGL